MSERLCVCGHPQGRHLLAQRDCKSCPECTQFEAAESVALDVGALLGEVQADADREAELAARLADVERERNELSDTLDRLSLENVSLQKDIERLGKHEEIRAQVIRERNDERARLQAEADSLAIQLEQAEQYARDLQERGIEPGAERLYDTHVRYLCTLCGARYREFLNHPCGRLKPVRVVITFIEE
jgi:septal ring factor EnvC (AmiA/AmiB activator)